MLNLLTKSKTFHVIKNNKQLAFIISGDSSRTFYARTLKSFTFKKSQISHHSHIHISQWKFPNASYSRSSLRDSKGGRHRNVASALRRSFEISAGPRWISAWARVARRWSMQRAGFTRTRPRYVHAFLCTWTSIRPALCECVCVRKSELINL